MEFDCIELQAATSSRHRLASGTGVGTSMRTRAWLLGLAVLAFVAGCDSVPGRSDDPWEQNWLLSHIEMEDGSRHDDNTTPQGAGVAFRPALQGSNGCDLFSGRYEYTDPRLIFSDIEYQYAESHPIPADCPEEALTVASAMRSALRDGVTITTMTSDAMVWESGGITFEFYPGVEG
jgi:hypothetical protein